MNKFDQIGDNREQQAPAEHDLKASAQASHIGQLLGGLVGDHLVQAPIDLAEQDQTSSRHPGNIEGLGVAHSPNRH